MGAPWQELSIINDVVIDGKGSSATYPDIWFNGQISSNSAPVQHYVIDVTNANTLTFTYDYNTSNDNYYVAKCTLGVNYGYALQQSTAAKAPIPKLVQVDTGVTFDTVFTDLGIDIIGNTVTLDVKDFTSIVLSFQSYFDSNSYATTQYGYAHLYNIKIS